MPGTLMAMARLNRPSLMIYGGTIKPGMSTETGGLLDIVSAFQSYGACAHVRVRVRVRVCACALHRVERKLACSFSSSSKSGR
eukprot:1151985-Pelagomonas_calceolata.AAC.5